MENLLSYANVKEYIVYAVFGGIMGYNLFWISYGIVNGVKWVSKKLKALKKKKEETPNE